MMSPCRLAASTFTAAGVRQGSSSFRARAPISAVHSGRDSKVMGCLPDARHPMGRAGAKGDICFSLPVVRQRYQPYGRQGIAPRTRERPWVACLVWRDSQSSASPSSRPQPHQHDQSHKRHRPRRSQRLPSQQPPTSAPPLPGSPATKTPSRRISRRAAPTFTWAMFRVSHFWWPWLNTPPTPPLSFVRLPPEPLAGPSSRNVARPSVSANAWWSCTSRDARPDTWRARLASAAPRC